MSVIVQLLHSWRLLERSAKEGDSPVSKMFTVCDICIPEYGGTREIPSEFGSTMT